MMTTTTNRHWILSSTVTEYRATILKSRAATSSTGQRGVVDPSSSAKIRLEIVW